MEVEKYVLRLFGKLKMKPVPGAAGSPDGRRVAVRTNRSVVFYRAPEMLSGGAKAFRFDPGSVNERQGEGIALGGHGAVYLVGEGGARSRPGTLARLICL